MWEWCNPVSNMFPCVKGVEWGMGTRGLKIVAAFSVGIQVEVTKKAGIVPRRRCAAIKIPFWWPHKTRRETVGVFYPCPQKVLVTIIRCQEFLNICTKYDSFRLLYCR